MRYLILALPLLVVQSPAAQAQVSVGVGIQVPGVSIGVDVPAFPDLVPMPGCPVYYAPGVNANFFYYDGLYWVYQADNWYASTWYNGPWSVVQADDVPAYVLCIPVRYYRVPPPYFRAWSPDGPPHWGERWGAAWQQRREGWERMDRRQMPVPAPLPLYQRQFPAGRYPGSVEQQHEIRSQNFNYQPREAIGQRHFQPPGEQQRMERQEGMGRERR